MGLFFSRKKKKNDSKKISDNEDFINLIYLAQEDISVKKQLLAIVGMPSDKRKAFLNVFIPDLRKKKAPKDFVEALSFLSDDEIAQKVEDLLLKH